MEMSEAGRDIQFPYSPERIIGMRKTNSMAGMEIISKLYNYEEVKDKLILRPLNYPDHAFELQNNVYRRLGDIALVLYGLISDNGDEGVTTFRIPRGIFERWGLDEDIVIDQALMMTALKAPARLFFTPMEMLSAGTMTGAFMTSAGQAGQIGKWDVPIVTTTRRINGAIAVFYPGVFERISQMYGKKNYFIVFTSIHEARLHCEDSVPPVYMADSLSEINRSFEADEILSREIFYYDMLEKRLRVFNPLANMA